MAYLHGGKKTDAEVKHKNSVYDYVNSLLLIFLLPKIICMLEKFILRIKEWECK